jgi:hypothetical protein
MNIAETKVAPERWCAPRPWNRPLGVDPMVDRICPVMGMDGVECGRRATRLGMCERHYRRTRSGVPLNTPIREVIREHGAICERPDCGNPYFVKGLCVKHYSRQRSGRPLNDPDPRPLDCSVDDCGRLQAKRGLCDTHYSRVHRGQSIDTPVRPMWHTGEQTCKTPGCSVDVKVKGLCSFHYGRLCRGVPLDAPIPERRPVPGYSAAHWRVAARRGRAQNHICACGSPAEDWAYRWRDAGQRLYDESKGMWYSLDPADYQAKCLPCHAAYDARRRSP